MLKRIATLCSKYPWIVFFTVIVITFFMVKQIKDESSFEADISKFLPKDIPAVKSDDYYKKNYNYQEIMLIGVEKNPGSVLEPRMLRDMENIVFELKDLKAEKSFDSRLTGKKETLTLPVGIDSENVMAISNLEDAILDRATGAVVSGSVIEKLKNDFHIPSSPGKEDCLPASDDDLSKIIPGLKKRILEDRIFRDNILTQDMHAATIKAPMIHKWAYKKRYAVLELSTAIDESRLKARFQGKDVTFPFNIYGKTIDGILIDNSYIHDHVEKTRKKLGIWLKGFLKPTLDQEPELKKMLQKEMTIENFSAVVSYLERKDFFMHPKMDRWENYTNQIYAFMLDRIDPFSRENLEFQLLNVESIYDFAQVYYLVRGVLDKYDTDDVNFYVAGQPVVFGIFTEMMEKDMKKLIPLAVFVVLIILWISFRSLRGVIIPSVTVIMSVLWTLGLMAFIGIPFTISTSILPIILLAVGTAYGIHLLNRYYEDTKASDDRLEIVQTSVTNVGVAIVMAAVTTMAGFSSLTSSSLTMIKHFGIFSAVGVGVALILTLTLTPAMLIVWRLPKNHAKMKNNHRPESDGFFPGIMNSGTKMIGRNPKPVFFFLLALFFIASILMTRNYFEGGIIVDFKKDSIVYKSDEFLNKHLTGTSDINLIFKFREQINLQNAKVEKDFRTHIKEFCLSWNRFLTENPELNTPPLSQLTTPLLDNADKLPGSQTEVIKQIALFTDILNEEYMVELPSSEQPDDISQDTSQDDLESLDEDDGDGFDSLADDPTDDPEGEERDDLAGLADDSPETGSDDQSRRLFTDLTEEQILGLKDLNKRVNAKQADWEKTGKLILTFRKLIQSARGVQLQHSFNLMTDFLAVDIKQPDVLHRLETLYAYLKGMKTPEVVIQGETMKPTGFVITPVDFVNKFYKVFYHDDNPAFDRLPDVVNDGFEDKTLTDRSIIGVVLNQALNANRDDFESMITPDLKEFQVHIMLRSEYSNFIQTYLQKVLQQVNTIFPDDDPYIENVRVGGGAPTSMAVTRLISVSQSKSIALSFLFVFIVTFFIFRSVIGGLYSLIPLVFTVILNFGLIAVLGGEITTGIMMVASISIGTGIDYTIHFLERFKIQLRMGDSLTEAYTNTTLSSGKAILLNALAVALGFLVLLFSQFVANMMMGILMAGTMFFSSIGALLLLPAIILMTRPKFLGLSEGV